MRLEPWVQQFAGRRRLILAALALPFCRSAAGQDGVATPVRTVPNGSGAGAYAGLRRWGSGSFRRFGFLIYDATLWAGDDPQRPPLALRLDYHRSLEGKAIASASVNEMVRLFGERGVPSAWGEAMRRVFPDVRAGDHLVGVHRDGAAHFYQGERLLGVIDAPGFAPAFFAIWLDARTSAPDLRQALLARKEA